MNQLDFDFDFDFDIQEKQAMRTSNIVFAFFFEMVLTILFLLKVPPQLPGIVDTYHEYIVLEGLVIIIIIGSTLALKVGQ